MEENEAVKKQNNSLTKKVDRISEELAIAEETINYYREEIFRGEDDGQATDREESAQDTTGKEDVDGEVGEDS